MNCCNPSWRSWRLGCNDFWTSQWKGGWSIHILTHVFQGQKKVRLHVVS